MKILSSEIFNSSIIIKFVPRELSFKEILYERDAIKRAVLFKQDLISIRKLTIFPSIFSRYHVNYIRSVSYNLFSSSRSPFNLAPARFSKITSRNAAPLQPA